MARAVYGGTTRGAGCPVVVRETGADGGGGVRGCARPASLHRTLPTAAVARGRVTVVASLVQEHYPIATLGTSIRSVDTAPYTAPAVLHRAQRRAAVRCGVVVVITALHPDTPTVATHREAAVGLFEITDEPEFDGTMVAAPVPGHCVAVITRLRTDTLAVAAPRAIVGERDWLRHAPRADLAVPCGLAPGHPAWYGGVD
mmetsp:Transcript_3630/g.9149  ORF Transcript_3630/g.9149 Transcript_3630/m.9149 type:complete len:200 (+) Transcript_3630:1442-2041(+)